MREEGHGHSSPSAVKGRHAAATMVRMGHNHMEAPGYVAAAMGTWVVREGAQPLGRGTRATEIGRTGHWEGRARSFKILGETRRGRCREKEEREKKKSKENSED